MRPSDGFQLALRFRERDVKRGLAVPDALDQELEPESRLSDARISLQ
jgi:hypothetical protein